MIQITICDICGQQFIEKPDKCPKCDSHTFLLVSISVSRI